ncbi:MAG TPA: RidA family protein [Spirochaetota bacterium]|nr:RidA family protein [Spirochaetota bacterium]
MQKKEIITPEAPKAVGPYSQGVVCGDFIFVSGQIPFTKEGKLVSEDVKDQTRQSLLNIEAVLKACQSDKSKIVKTTIFLTDLTLFQSVNEVYANFFEGTVFPARSTIEVSKLPKDAKIEIEAIAKI